MLPMRKVIDAIRQAKMSNDFYDAACNDADEHSLPALWKELGDISIHRASGGHDGFF